MVEVKHYRYSIILYIIYIIFSLSLYIYILYYIYYVLYILCIIYIYILYIHKVLQETCYQSSFWTLLGGASLLTS